MYGEVFVSTISLVFLLLMAFLKLVAKIIYQVCLVSGLPSRLRMYAVNSLLISLTSAHAERKNTCYRMIH